MDATINGVTASAVQYSPTQSAPAPAPLPATGSGAGGVASVAAGAGASVVAVAATDVAGVSDGTPAVSDGSAKSGTKGPTLAQVQKAVDDINSTLNANQNTAAVQFAIDPSSKKIVVQMIDMQTGKVLSQYPSEQIIQMGLALGKKLGQLINQQA